MDYLLSDKLFFSPNSSSAFPKTWENMDCETTQKALHEALMMIFLLFHRINYTSNNSFAEY